MNNTQFLMLELLTANVVGENSRHFDNISEKELLQTILNLQIRQSLLTLEESGLDTRELQRKMNNCKIEEGRYVV